MKCVLKMCKVKEKSREKVFLNRLKVLLNPLFESFH